MDCRNPKKCGPGSIHKKIKVSELGFFKPPVLLKKVIRDKNGKFYSYRNLGSEMSYNTRNIFFICFNFWISLLLAEPKNKPNIILFMADDMGLGDTSAYHK